MKEQQKIKNIIGLTSVYKDLIKSYVHGTNHEIMKLSIDITHVIYTDIPRALSTVLLTKTNSPVFKMVQGQIEKKWNKQTHGARLRRLIERCRRKDEGPEWVLCNGGLWSLVMFMSWNKLRIAFCDGDITKSEYVITVISIIMLIFQCFFFFILLLLL